jgi:5-hydroxyisourate hydrolase-like protein (transthyretin family)
MKPKRTHLKNMIKHVVAALCVGGLCVMAVAQQTVGVPKRGNSMVTGRLTLEGKPAEGIKVVLISADETSDLNRIAAHTISDKDGFFRLTGVPAGAFTLSIAPNAFVLPDEGYRRSSGKSVVVIEGQNLSDVNLELRRGGVITGRVTDIAAEPLIDAQVSLHRVDDQNRKSIVPLGNQSGTTDDLGVFRIYGLRPGKYLASVTRRSAPLLPTDQTEPRFYTPTTYYPGVQDESRAVVLEVKEGIELRDVDIPNVSVAQTYSAVGQVLSSETSNGVAGIGVTLKRTTATASADPPTLRHIKTDAGGRFRLAGLKPGQYLLLTVPGTGNYYTEPLPFEIRDADVRGLEVKLSKGSSLTGFVESVEGAVNSSFRSKLDQLSVHALQIDRSNQFGATVLSSSQVNPNGTFTLNGLKPGQVKLTIHSGQSKEISLARVEVGGMDRTQGIPVGLHENISNVRLILTFGLGHIRGQVKRRDGPLPPDRVTTVAAIPLISSGSRRVFANVDEQGRFSFMNLPPGEYEIQVVSRGAPNANGIPQFLSAKKSVTINSGSGTEVLLIVEAAPQ